MPVSFEPGSSFTTTGWTTDSASDRSTIRIVKGLSLCTRALPALRSFLALAGPQGISGLWSLSRTKTFIMLFTLRFLTNALRRASFQIEVFPSPMSTASFSSGRPFRAFSRACLLLPLSGSGAEEAPRSESCCMPSTQL